MCFFMLNQLPEGKNIYGKPLGDPNVFNKRVQVKYATGNPAPTEEMGSKKVEMWVGPQALMSACPKCHYYSVVEMPSSVGYAGLYHQNTEDIRFTYHCEWCGESFEQMYVSWDQVKGMYHRFTEAIYQLHRLVHDGEKNKPTMIKRTDVKKLLDNITIEVK